MINFGILDESVRYYEANGFVRIESPWTVSPQINRITAPKDVTLMEFKHNDKCLVASGEQSFLYLYLKGFLPKGQFQTITPCFRYETFDFLHTKYFIKNELIKTDIVNKKELENIIDIALKFFSKYFYTELLQVVRTEFGFDIEYKGNELGSYGIRECEFLNWIYATGCAEPRLSNIMSL